MKRYDFFLCFALLSLSVPNQEGKDLVSSFCLMAMAFFAMWSDQ